MLRNGKIFKNRKLSNYGKNTELKMQMDLSSPYDRYNFKITNGANPAKKPLLTDCFILLEKQDLQKWKEKTIKDSIRSSSNFFSDISNKTKGTSLENRENNCVKKKKSVSFSDTVTVHQVHAYYQCKKCSRFFPDHRSLKSHKNEVHKMRRFTCTYCAKDFINKKFFKSHIKLHCNSCFVLFINKRCYLKHKRTVCKMITNFKCKLCHIALFRFMDITDAVLKQSRTIFICDLCSDSVNNKCVLAQHIKFIHFRKHQTLFKKGINNRYRCDFCKKNFNDKGVIDGSLFPNLEESNKGYYKDYNLCALSYNKCSTESHKLKHKWTHILKKTKKNEKKSKSNMDQKTYYNINEILPSFLQPKLVLKKLALPKKKIETIVNPNDLTNIHDSDVKNSIIDQISKKTLGPKASMQVYQSTPARNTRSLAKQRREKHTKYNNGRNHSSCHNSGA